MGKAIGGGVRSIEVGEGVVINGLSLGLLVGVGLGKGALGVGEIDGGKGSGLELFTGGDGDGLLLGGDLVGAVEAGIAIGLKQRSIWSLNTQPLLPLGC